MAIITISRGTLTGGEVLAESLRSKLGYEVLSREVIIEAAKKYGVEEARMAEEMQTAPGLWKRITHGVDRYIMAMQATLADMIQDDNVIYHGYAGPLLLKGVPHVVKVRLIAPLDYRIRTGMVEFGYTREEAIAHIETVDEQRSKWVQTVYGMEWTDAALYDLVFNFAFVSVESCTDLVARLVERREGCATAEEKQALKDFALANRVRAELAFRSTFAWDALEVNAHAGVVDIQGDAYLEKHREEISRFVGSLDGVIKVESGESAPHLAGARPPDEKLARDIMIPIDNYPHVPQHTSVREALLAIGASSIQLPDGHIMAPRYILAVDDEDRLVGILSRRNLVRGLMPHLDHLKQSEQEVRSVVPFAGESFSLASAWLSLFTPAAVRQAQEPVKAIMGGIRGTVTLEDDLNAVISTMLDNAIDLVPVMDGDRAVGVVLMTEVYDVVAQFILENPTGEDKNAGS